LKSEDDGVTWRQVTSQAVRSIAFDAQVPQRIYFASVTAGIMVSTDGGKTVRETNAGFANRNFAVLTGGRGTLYTSSVFEPGSGGIYRTDNYGLRWQRSAGEPGQDFRLLTASPDQPGMLFAAGYHGLFKSSDGGKTWNGKITFPEGVGHLRSLLALPHNVILAGTDQGLYRSTDGLGWKMADGPGGVINSLERSGVHVVSVLSTQGAFASTDSGMTWKSCGEPSPSAVWYGLAFDNDQADAATALAATSTGLFRSTDGCQSWSKATGLLADTVSIVLFHPTRAGEAFAAQGGKVFRSTDQGQHWAIIDDTGRGRSWPSSLVILPESPDRLFALFPRRGVLWNTVEVEQGTPAANEPAVRTAK
jgi:photosystem II stability/assembly factor-like uncharacterized protein